MWEPYPICAVDIYHAWWTGNDVIQFAQWISTTIFAWDWPLSNLCGGYLPPYLHGGLEMILIGNDFYVGTLSNLCGGYLPPYLHGGFLAMWEPYFVQWISTTIFAWWIE
jgi:hypothetical protein